VRIDVVELGGCDEGVESGSPSAALIRSGEGPVAAANCYSPQLALGRIVGHAQAAITEEAGKLGPALEAVIDGFPGIAVLGHSGAFSRNQVSNAIIRG
jgi:hypothetical protein